MMTKVRLLERKKANHQGTFAHEMGPLVCHYTDSEEQSIRFEYDAVGRRIRRDTPEGNTFYSYNLLGQLERVQTPSGIAIRYLYDGFGRLVGRIEGEATAYYILDLDGRRLAEADGQGHIVFTYLWVGGTCVGRIDGHTGEPLTHSFHRSYGNRLVAIGDNSGSLHPVGGEDPYGADTPIRTGIPAFAGLFGDPDTGLLHAGSRWYDPQIIQFLTPDSWFGDELGRRMANPAFRLLDQTPGWTTRPLTPSAAYAWCNGDPLNYSDPSGHNWFGLIFTTLSAFFWEMQLTSVSLQMHVINFIVDTIQVIPVFRPLWDTDGYFRNSVYNIAAPVASYRLMVPFALILNGVLNVQDVCWTLGSVIWARGTQLRRLEGLSKRELLLCANAQDYLAVTNVAAAASRRFHARNPQARANGTVDGTGSRVTGLTVTAPVGMTPADLLQPGDFVAVKLAAVAGDELRRVTNSVGGIIDLDRPLPSTFQTQAVEVTRLDQPVVKIVGANKIIARFVAFVRGKAIHFAAQIPKDYPTNNLDITEHLTTGEARHRGADFPAEKILLRMAKATDVTGYAANHFVRISGGSATVARRVERLSGTTDLFLDRALPANMERLDTVRMNASGAVVANQTGRGDRVTCGPMSFLVPLDGLTIENTGAATVTVERRIVKQIILDCVVDALPAPLHFIAVKVDILTPDATKRATGKVAAALEITADAGQATRFSRDQPIQITKGGLTHAYSVVESVDGPTNKITLREPLPVADFSATTVVTVTLLKATNTLPAENVAAPGDHLLVLTPFGNTLTANTIIRIRPAPDSDGGSVRRVKAIPEVTARVDSVLPATHLTPPLAANTLSVQRFVEDPATKRKGVRAPSVRWRLTVLAGGVPYANGDEIFIERDEESIGKIFAINGSQIILQDPIELSFITPVNVYALTATGKRTANAKLDEGQVMVPSDPKVLLTRREALEHHEMRHVFQGAKWGPFLLQPADPLALSSWLFVW